MNPDSNLADSIERFVKERSHVTFVELENEFPQIKGEISMSYGHENVILWSCVNETFVDTLNGLLKAKRIFMWPAVNALCYVLDGKTLALPNAKSIRPYKKPRWLKVTFHHRAPRLADFKKAS